MLLAALALFSMLLGVFRDRLTAGIFGSSSSYDAFVVAQTIPTLILNIFLGGAVTSAFVPRFLYRLHKEGPEEAWRFTQSIAILVGITGFAFTGLAWCFSDAIVDFVGSGLEPHVHQMAVATTRKVVFALPFYVGSTVSAAILNAHEHFGAPGARPLTNNLILLTFLTTVASAWGVEALVWAFVIGAFVQWAIQMPQLWKIMRPHLQRPSIQPDDIREFLARFVPVFFVHLCLQGATLLDRRYSTEAHASGASLFGYAERFLNYSRMAIAGSLGVVILPRLSSMFARNEDASTLIGKAFGVVGLLTIPATLALTFYGDSFVALLLEHGEFTRADTLRVAQALLGLAPGLLFLGIVFLLDRILVAQDRIWLWVSMMATGLAVNMLLKSIFSTTYGLLAVGGASSVGYAITGLWGMLWLMLRSKANRKTMLKEGVHDMAIIGVCFFVAFALPYMIWRIAELNPPSAITGVALAMGSALLGTIALLFLNPPSVAFFRTKISEKLKRT